MVQQILKIYSGELLIESWKSDIVNEYIGKERG